MDFMDFQNAEDRISKKENFQSSPGALNISL